MISWLWLIPCAMIAGSMGALIMAIFAGGSADHKCPHGDNYDDCPDCRH
jgi:hypothetical protein